MIDPPRIVSTVAQPMAFLHLIVPRSEIRHVMGPGLQEVMAVIAAAGRRPEGPWFTHHLKMDPATFDFRICVPVAKPIAPSGRVQSTQLPARLRVARTIYHGPYQGLPGAWSEFEKWIGASGYTSAPDLWEVYALGPESGPDSSKWRTELNRPLVD